MSEQTEIYSFKVSYGNGCGKVSGRVEAKNMQHATDRITERFAPIDRGSVSLLKNQDAARKGKFWAIEAPTSPELPMKVFWVEDDGHYAANSEDEFRAWYIEQFGDECKECVDELNEMSLDGMQKCMVLVSDEGEKQTLLQVLLDHVARNGKTITMLSCENH